MPDARVLITDDSVVIRRLLSRIIEEEPGLEVAGVAQNGRIALSKVDRLAPDLVVLDIEMPEMNGLEALEALRKTHPSLPVVMFSTLTKRGASATLDALSLGASDYLTKPDTAGGLTAALEVVRSQLVPKIRALCGQAPAKQAAPPPRPAPRAATKPRPVPRRTPGQPIQVVAIGISTGGPNALMTMLPRFSPGLAVPVLIVQHMPPMFTRLLAERLDAKCPLAVREATHGTRIRPGEVWIAPGDYHMTVSREDGTPVLRLNQDPQENSCRPAADVLFRSVADCYGAKSLALVMTGMGQDGFRGAGRVRESGGVVLAQDEATSVVWGMPGFVAREGLSDEVLALDDLPDALDRWTRGAQKGAPPPALTTGGRTS
jgi:two-component system chemotaxis response regulator CheB